MAYKQLSPIPVDEGGTGAQTLTDHGVVLGSGTGAVTVTAVGTTGQVLTGVTGADPAWAAPAASSISITGDTGGALVGAAFTFAGGTTGLSFGGSGSTETLTFAGITANGGVVDLGTDATDNAINIGTAASAGRTITIGNATGTSAVAVNCGTGGATFGTSAVNHTTSIGGATGSSTTIINCGSGGATFGISAVQHVTQVGSVTGNSSLVLNVGTGGATLGTNAVAHTILIGTGAAAKTVTIGSTNTTSSLALQYGTADFTLASATGTVMSALDTGEITYPLQSAFGAYLGTTDNNATGDGTNFQLGSGNALTEVFDQNSDFVTTGTFTAPVTGKYFFFFGVLTQNTDIAHTTWQPQITTTANTFNLCYQNGFVNNAASAFLGGNGAVFCQMTAGDTCTFNVIISGGTKTVEIVGNSGLTFMGGHLVC